MQRPVLARRGRPRKDRRPHYLIAATVDYRGPDDDQLTFVFRGLTMSMLRKAFTYLVGQQNGIARQVIIIEEHDIIRRNGKGFWRLAVSVHDPNYQFASLDDMKLLISGVLTRLYSCTVRWFPIDKFLNI